MMLRLARGTRPVLPLARMASPDPSRRIGQQTVGSVGSTSDLSRWNRRMTAILCSQYTWGPSRKRSSTTKTSMRTLILITGWTRDSTMAWFRQQTPPTHGSVAASTAWKRVIVGESVLKCLCCQSCKEFTRQRGFKPERERWRQGSPRPPTKEGQRQARGPEAPRQEPSMKQTTPQTPFRYWNQDALSRWLGPENLGWAQIDGRRTRVLLDTGARVNPVTPAYVRKHKLKVGSVSTLDHSLNPFGKRVPLVGVGGCTHTLGYVLIRVQVEGVPGYDEDQVAFVIDDPTTTFGIRVPIVLGTPTINRVIAIMKESDLQNARSVWILARVSLLIQAGIRLIWTRPSD